MPASSRQAFTSARQRMLAEHPGDEAGRMLQSPGVRTGGRFYGFTAGDDLIVKLPAARVRELLDSGEGLPCSPRPGRPMREWVRVPSPDESACVSYLSEARAFLTGSVEDG
jgi:hypothetical protein